MMLSQQQHHHQTKATVGIAPMVEILIMWKIRVTMTPSTVTRKHNYNMKTYEKEYCKIARLLFLYRALCMRAVQLYHYRLHICNHVLTVMKITVRIVTMRTDESINGDDNNTVNIKLISTNGGFGSSSSMCNGVCLNHLAFRSALKEHDKKEGKLDK